MGPAFGIAIRKDRGALKRGESLPDGLPAPDQRRMEPRGELGRSDGFAVVNGEPPMKIGRNTETPDAAVS